MPAGRPKTSDESDATRISLRGFSRSLHKRLKRYALEHDVSLEYVFNRAVREWLAQQEKHDATT